MENKNSIFTATVQQRQNDKYKVDQTDALSSPEDSPHFQVYESLEKKTEIWSVRGQISPNIQTEENIFDQKMDKKRSLTDDGKSFKMADDTLFRSLSHNGATTADTLSHYKNPAQNIKLSQPQPLKRDQQVEYLQHTDKSLTQEDSKDESFNFYMIPDFQEKLFQGTLENLSPKKMQDVNSYNQQLSSDNQQLFNFTRENNQKSDKKKLEHDQSLTSQIKEKVVNLKYFLGDNKPKTTWAQFFSYQKVTFDNKDSFPIILLHHIFYVDQIKYQKALNNKAALNNEILKKKKEFFPYLYTIIWSTYRKNFKPLLGEDFRIMSHIENTFGQHKLQQAFTNTDCNWGCTLRVGQMMICQALQRHLIGDNYYLDKIVEDKRLSRHYKFILRLILDNDDTRTGAFSIQNIARMGLVHNKLPGEWYGPQAISVMLKDLNKLYMPCENFQICLFHDGNIYLDKILKIASRRNRDINYLKQNYPHNPEKQSLYTLMEFIFQKQIQKMQKELKQASKTPKQKEETKENDQNQEWRNSVLVIIPTRLGLNKINKEYYNPILKFFQCNLNAGIIGGKPSQAFYFVGTQQKDLIFLDPHLVQPTVDYTELPQEHLSYHCASAKKIHVSKIDTSLAFGFYLRDYKDFERFQDFVKEGKHVYQDNWLFSIFDQKPKYLKFNTYESANYFLPPTVQYNESSQREALKFENISQQRSQVPKKTQQLQSQKIQQVANQMQDMGEEDDDFELI